MKSCSVTQAAEFLAGPTIVPWLGMGRMRQLRDKMWGIKATPKPLGVNHSLSAEKEWEERV